VEATLTATVLDCAHRKLVTALQSLEMEKAIHDQSTSLKDYWELTKPTVVALMLLTSVVGMLMAVPGMVPAKILILGNLGIALCAASAATLNHLVDRAVDRIMSRTRNRPIAQGRVGNFEAIVFSGILGIVGFWILLTQINALTAWLTLASLLGYALIYTVFLKRATPQNIVIGGLAGATPPLLGWTAVTGQIESDSLLLVLIIFAWTPPHFWALAIHRKDDYKAVDIPMLPVTHGTVLTRLHIFLYVILMVVISLLPYASGMSGEIYLVGALLLGGRFLWLSAELMRDENPTIAMHNFKFSITYLTALFVVMLIDHYLIPLGFI